MKMAYENYKFRSLVGEKTDWNGYWITSQRFYHIPSCHKYGYNRLPEFNSEIQNIHTLFRKSFVLGENKIKSAKMFITGDDLYKLYINGDFVGEGPAQSYPFSYNYNCFDVTDLLKSGDNTIGVHLYYQGLFNIYLLSADNLCGMAAQLEIDFYDGSSQTIVSDKSWKYTECEAYSFRYMHGYQTVFSEDMDLNKYPSEWRNTDFDETDWERVFIQSRKFPPEYNLVPQVTPTVKHEKKFPVEIKRLDNGYWFDFGEELTGNLSFCIKGEKGDVIELRFGEELNEDGSVRYKLRANCTYSDLVTLSGKEEFVESFDYKGFRYAEILNIPQDINPQEVYVFNRHYPFPENAAYFKSSNEKINKIWDLCYRTVKIGTQDTYYDCPTRERGGFIGDAFLTGLVHLYLTADIRIYKKFLIDCANGSRYFPPLMGHVPSYNISMLIEYACLIPMMLEQYYQFTADKEFVKEMLPVAEGIFDFYEDYLNEDFLLEGLKHADDAAHMMGVILVDWPENLRDNYDFDLSKTGQGICTIASMFFYGFLKSMSGLYRLVGDNERSEELELLYTKIGNAIIEKTYDYKTGLFRDTPDSTHSALHANVMPLYFGLDVPGGHASIVKLISEKRLNCNVAFAYFVIEALYRIGENELASNLLNGEDEHSWYNMVRENASCLMEAWGADQKWNTSLSHPWGSSPIYFYATKIMGIEAAKAGMKHFKISPKICDELDWAEIELPIPLGKICAKMKHTADGIEYTVSAPEDVKLDFEGENIKFSRI